jgi:hypothetical protein
MHAAMLQPHTTRRADALGDEGPVENGGILVPLLLQRRDWIVRAGMEAQRAARLAGQLQRSDLGGGQASQEHDHAL